MERKLNKKLEFKKYISRFSNGFDTEYQDNGYGTGCIMYAIPRYHSIDAIQVNPFSVDLVKKLIESRSTLLDKISSHNDIPYIEFSINCIFHSSSDNPSYSITIYPGDYLIWDEEIHRFLVLPESVFLMLYKESSW